MRAHNFLALCGLSALLLAGCSDDSNTGPATVSKLTLEETDFSFSALGQNHLLVAHATDAGGHDLDANLVWSTSDPGVATVNGDGLATAISPGEAILSVHYGDLADTIHAVVSQVPANIAAEFGDDETGVPGQSLIVPLTVSVTDALGFRIRNVPIQWLSTSVGGSVSPDTGTTDFIGENSTTMTLGNAEGDYTAVASIPGTSLSVTFTEHAAQGGPYNIELAYLTSASPGVKAAFADAKARWESIITADLPDDYATLPAYSCGASPALDRPIDDLIIFVTIQQMDGPGGILGGGGPCFMHDTGGLTAIGAMTFDQDDLQSMQNDGTLTDVITHEMGHVLGIGTLWDAKGFLANPSLSGGLDPSFTGPLAIAEFDTEGGAAYTGAKVPVEDQGGYGTADAHWRETIFGNELMTGYISYPPNPLSGVTIASLADLGYSVDMSKADAFSLGPFIRRGAGAPPLFKPLHQLVNDIMYRPTGILGKKGQPMRRIKP